MRKITLQLDVGKTVELMGFNVSGSSTVQMTLRFVELDIEVLYCYDFSGYPAWRKENLTKTWRDYVKETLLSIYDSLALAKQVRDLLNSEAAKA